MNDTLSAIDIGEILRLLPHRYPFVMIDRLIDMRADEHAIGIKNVTVNEPQFIGHFPDNPVMPGVLVIEGMAQTAGMLCLWHLGAKARGRKVYFLTIDKAKFRKPAIPGDTIEYHVDKIAHRRNMWWYRAEAKVGGALIAEAEVGAMIRGLDGDRSDRARRRRRAHWRGRGDRAVLPGRAARRACKRRAPDRPCQRHRCHDDRRGHRGLSVLVARHAAAIGALSRRRRPG